MCVKPIVYGVKGGNKNVIDALLLLCFASYMYIIYDMNCKQLKKREREINEYSNDVSVVA